MLRVALVLLFAFVPAAAAQIPIGAPSLPVNANEQDFGSPGVPTDNCWVLDMDAVASAGATSFDLRLSPCLGRGPGTEIGDGDTVERGAPYPQANGAAAEGVRYADVNSNGRYDGGDYVYLTSAAGAGTGLVATTATGAWTIRLTATGPDHGNRPAGSLVLQQDADCMAYCTAAADFGPASVGWFDDDNTGSYTPGDVAFLMPTAPGAPAGSLVPAYSLRLTATPVASPKAPETETDSPSSSSASTMDSPPSETDATTEPSSGTTSEGPKEPRSTAQAAWLPMAALVAAVAAGRRRLQ